MKRHLAFLLILVLVAGCGSQTTPVVYQTSTIDALLAGVYDGEVTCGELTRRGNFGIGTFDALDGEMVVLEGTVYQVKADGKVYRPALSTKTPFATVCRFAPETAKTVPTGTDFAALKKTLDRLAPNPNLFYAIKLTGRFKTMKTRSVPRQSKPYPPLKEVTANQPEFEMKEISGTIVGFRCPPFVKGVNVPGYHLHFLSDDATRGGHILAFTVESARCEIAALSHYTLVLPGSGAFGTTDLSKDREHELQQVEQ